MDSVSEEAVIEAVLNFGDFDDVKEIIGILGVEKTLAILHHQIEQARHNYNPKIRHYFERFLLSMYKKILSKDK